MIFVFRILGYIAIIGTGICVLLAAFYLWFFVRNALDKEKYTLSDFAGWISREFGLLSPKAYLIFVVASLFATLITNTAVHDLVGLHNLHLKPDGTYCFYVKISDYNNTYTLPAQISIEEYDIEKGEKTYTKRMYFIEKVYFSNGGYLDFEGSDSVEINKSNYFSDQHGKEWECSLLNKHAYSPQIKETNNADWISVTFLVIALASKVLVLLALIKGSDD